MFVISLVLLNVIHSRVFAYEYVYLSKHLMIQHSNTDVFKSTAIMAQTTKYSQYINYYCMHILLSNLSHHFQHNIQ